MTDASFKQESKNAFSSVFVQLDLLIGVSTILSFLVKLLQLKIINEIHKIKANHLILMFIVYKLDTKGKQSGKQIKIAYDLLTQMRDNKGYWLLYKYLFYSVLG